MRGQQVNILNILLQMFLVAFLMFLWIKKSFSSQTGHVFFRRLYLSFLTCHSCNFPLPHYAYRYTVKKVKFLALKGPMKTEVGHGWFQLPAFVFTV
jgi:hypothetical protein